MNISFTALANLQSWESINSQLRFSFATVILQASSSPKPTTCDSKVPKSPHANSSEWPVPTVFDKRGAVMTTSPWRAGRLLPPRAALFSTRARNVCDERRTATYPEMTTRRLRRREAARAKPAPRFLSVLRPGLSTRESGRARLTSPSHFHSRRQTTASTRSISCQRALTFAVPTLGHRSARAVGHSSCKRRAVRHQSRSSW